jgi:hypothetical protein
VHACGASLRSFPDSLRPNLELSRLQLHMRVLTATTIPLALFAFLALSPKEAGASHHMTCKVKAEVTKSEANRGATHTTFRVTKTRGKYCKQFYKNAIATIIAGGPHAISHKIGAKISVEVVRISSSPGHMGANEKPRITWSFASAKKMKRKKYSRREAIRVRRLRSQR